MQKQVVILSLTLAAVSTGTAVWLALRGPQAPAVVENSTAPRAAAKLNASAAGIAKPGNNPAGKPASAAQLDLEDFKPGIGLIREDLQEPTSPEPARPASVSEVPAAELANRVAKIETETNHEMRRLVGLLNLTEAQQDQVYEKLAASSRHWVPGMAIAADGSGAVIIPDAGAANPATDATEDIMSLLNADQQDTYLQSEMDRAAWWAEIITQLDAQTDIPAIDGTIPSEGDTKAYEGSETLE